MNEWEVHVVHLIFFRYCLQRIQTGLSGKLIYYTQTNIKILDVTPIKKKTSTMYCLRDDHFQIIIYF